MKTRYIIAAILVGAFSLPFLFPEPKPVAAPVQVDATNQLNFDQPTADARMRLDQGDVGMAICFDRAIRGNLRMGIRDRTAIIAFARNTCGVGFKRQLMLAGSSAAAADAYIDMAASDHLDAVLPEGAPHP